MRRLSFALLLALSLFPAFGQAPPPVPALPDTPRISSYSLIASNCSCAVNFQLYGDGTDYQNWVEVWINGARANYNDPLLGWTITSPSPGGLTQARPITDAVLTFTVAQTGTVQIVGARRPRRTSQFNENTGVPTRNLNQVFSDIIATMRETWDKTNDVSGRAIMGQPGETLNILAAASTRANTLLGFDGVGQVALYGTGTGGVTSATNINFVQGGVGAVSVTAQNKMRERISVADFGAIADGHTDNAAQIRAAVTYAQTFGTGSEVYFPPGNAPYCIMSQISITGVPVVLRGADQNVSVSSCAADITVFNLNAPGSGIVDLSIYGKGTVGLPTPDTVFGASNPTVVMTSLCVNCILDHIKVQGGSSTIQSTGGDSKIYRSEAGSAYGAANVIIRAGMWLHRNAFDQTWPVSFPAYPLTANAWAATTAYTSGQVVTTNGYYIQNLTGGTSGGSAPALKNYGATITDGSAVWMLVAPVSYDGLQIDTGAQEVDILQQDLSGPYNCGLGMRNTLAGLVPEFVSLGTGSVIGQGFTGGVCASSGNELIVDGAHIAGGVLVGSYGVVLSNSWTGRARITNNSFLTGTGNGVGVQAGASTIITNNHINTSTGNAVVVAPNVNSFVVSSNTLEAQNMNGVVVQSGTSDHYAIFGNINLGVSGTLILDSGSGTHKFVTGNDGSFVISCGGLPALTGDVTTSGCAATLASTITAAGPTGSATVVPIITYDAKGRLTAVSSATITPAIGSITGAGTGFLAAGAVNVGTAGSVVVNGGALGTPSSGVGTNLTGTAAGLTAGTANAVAVGNITGAGAGVPAALAQAANNGSGGIVTGGASSATDIMVSGGASSPIVGGTGCSIQAGGSIQCSTSSSSFPQYVLTNTAANLGAPAVIFKKSRTGGNSLANDFLGEVDFNGFANSAYGTSVIERVIQTGASSGSNIPSKWTLSTSNAAGPTNQTLTFDSNAHLAVTAQATAPTISAGCSGAGSAIGTGSADLDGWATGSTAAATTCTITFGTAFTNRPSCQATGEQSPILTMAPGTSTLVVTFASTVNYKFDWHCAGQ